MIFKSAKFLILGLTLTILSGCSTMGSLDFLGNILPEKQTAEEICDAADFSDQDQFDECMLASLAEM